MMNERIKELEKQSTTVVEGWSDENGTTRYYEFNREKFAELIVAECLVTLDSIVCDTSGERDTLWVARKVVAEHFGVE